MRGKEKRASTKVGGNPLRSVFLLDHEKGLADVLIGC